MPEGPELHLASKFINEVCKGRFFQGSVVKSDVSVKNPDVPWNIPSYTISSISRGKEIKVILHEADKNEDSKTVSILFRFGMSGCFKFNSLDNLPKHSHLRFFSSVPEPAKVLSFVDFRRFGRWEIDAPWGSDRGPCPILEYEEFRSNIFANLENPAFNRPICEAMLNQKFFNGIGNYLRAEVLFRAGMPPFEEARTALLPFKNFPYYPDGIKTEYPSTKCDKPPAITENKDPLFLCHTLPLEVLSLGGSKGYDVNHDPEEEETFLKWLRCYQNPSMKNLVDRNGRTIWFTGPAGRLAPHRAKTRKVRQSPSKKVKTAVKLEALEEETSVKLTKILKKPSVRKKIKLESIEPAKLSKVKRTSSQSLTPQSSKLENNASIPTKIKLESPESFISTKPTNESSCLGNKRVTRSVTHATITLHDSRF